MESQHVKLLKQGNFPSPKSGMDFTAAICSHRERPSFHTSPFLGTTRPEVTIAIRDTLYAVNRLMNFSEGLNERDFLHLSLVATVITVWQNPHEI